MPGRSIIGGSDCEDFRRRADVAVTAPGDAINRLRFGVSVNNNLRLDVKNLHPVDNSQGPHIPRLDEYGEPFYGAAWIRSRDSLPEYSGLLLQQRSQKRCLLQGLDCRLQR